MTKIRLAETYRQATSDPPEPCPSVEALAELAADSPLGSTDVVAHVERCAGCAEEVRLLLSLEHEISDQPRPHQTRWSVFAAAAMLVVTLGAALIYRSTVAPDSVQYRGEEIVTALPEDGAVLNEPPATLRWPEGTVRLQLFDSAGLSLLERSAVTSTIDLGPVWQQRDTKEDTYFWITIDANDIRVVRSFVLRPDSQ